MKASETGPYTVDERRLADNYDTGVIYSLYREALGQVPFHGPIFLVKILIIVRP